MQPIYLSSYLFVYPYTYEYMYVFIYFTFTLYLHFNLPFFSLFGNDFVAGYVTPPPLFLL